MLGDDALLMGKDKITGVMYLHGTYPRLYHQDPRGLNDTIQYEVEVYEIDGRNYEVIVDMELGAGYKAEQIHTVFGEATVFFNPIDYASNSDQYITHYPTKRYH